VLLALLLFVNNYILFVVSYTTPQNRLMRWELPPHINTCIDHLLSDVELFNKFLYTFWVDGGGENG